jgi:hypothetical protein
MMLRTRHGLQTPRARPYRRTDLMVRSDVEARWDPAQRKLLILRVRDCHVG